MTTRNRPVRTPRKDKSWAHQHSGGSGDSIVPVALVANALQVVVGLLSSYKTDLGVNVLERPTVMRILGTLMLGNGASQSTAETVSCVWGIAWVSTLVFGAAVSDPQIPDPNASGVREAQWVQRGALYHNASNFGQTFGVDQIRASDELDITQARKQPAVGDQLAFIARTQSSGGGIHAPELLYRFDTMLALS